MFAFTSVVSPDAISLPACLQLLRMERTKPDTGTLLAVIFAYTIIPKKIMFSPLFFPLNITCCNLVAQVFSCI